MEVLGSLDPSAGAALLTVKRLVRKHALKLTLRFPQSEGRADETVKLYPGQNVRRSLLARGVQLNDPFARRFDAGIGTGDCGGEGGCCTCSMEVESGMSALTEQKPQESRASRRRASCPPS